MKILVTGGCGYIGSHTVRLLSKSGHEVEVVDSLVTGFEDSLLHKEVFHKIDLGDVDSLQEVFSGGNFDAVIHFAASTVVPESVKSPLEYYENNTVGTIKLLGLVKKYKVPSFVFSSTAAVYGNVDGMVHENDACSPESPYGWSKYMDEQIIKDFAQSEPGLNYTILRYFNVAGAHSDGIIGQRTPRATHLIKVACEVAAGKRTQMEIYGTDYDTEDGTCVRDYIHVDDLASAHLEVLMKLRDGGESKTFNCGYGHGYSVKQVIEKVKEVSGIDFKVVEGPRREGDVVNVIANSDRLKSETSWEPERDSLTEIVKSAYDFEKSL